MNIKRLLAVAAFLMVAAMNFSCETESASEADDLYGGLKKSEVVNEDT